MSRGATERRVRSKSIAGFIFKSSGLSKLVGGLVHVWLD